MIESRELTLIAEGARMLAEAKGLFEVRDVRSIAIGAVAYARAKDMGEDAVRSASRIVILATSRLGEEIIAGQERGEIATGRDNLRRGPGLAVPEAGKATLSELGISWDVSSVAQQLARHGEAVQEYVAQSVAPSLAGALRIANAEAAGDSDEVLGRFLTDEDRVEAAAARMTNGAGALDELAKKWGSSWTPAQRSHIEASVGLLCKSLGGRFVRMIREVAS